MKPLKDDFAGKLEETSKTVKIRFLAGRVVALAGRVAPAQALAAELASELRAERTTSSISES